MSWGDLYYRLKSKWDNAPRADRLTERGFTTSYSGDDGLRWITPDSFLIMFQTMMNDNNDQNAFEKFLDAAAAWDPRDFERAFRVLPLDDPFSGNGTYTDARVSKQGKGTLLEFLNFVSGNQGGQIVYDPLIGRVWVPNNKGAFDPYRDFSGGGDFFTHWMDGGGLVKLFASLILGGALAPMVDGGGSLLNALGDVTGLAPSVSSGIVDVPYDVGGNLVNNPEVFTPDVPYDVGQNLVNNPDVFNPSTGNPLSNVPAPRIGTDPVTGDPVRVTDVGPPATQPTTPGAPGAPGANVSPTLLKLIPAATGALTALQRMFGSQTAGLTPAQQAQIYANQQRAQTTGAASTTSLLPLIALAVAFAGH